MSDMAQDSSRAQTYVSFPLALLVHGMRNTDQQRADISHSG